MEKNVTIEDAKKAAANKKKQWMEARKAELEDHPVNIEDRMLAIEYGMEQLRLAMRTEWDHSASVKERATDVARLIESLLDVLLEKKVITKEDMYVPENEDVEAETPAEDGKKAE